MTGPTQSTAARGRPRADAPAAAEGRVSEPHEEPRARLEPAARAAAVLTVSDRCVRGEAVDESGPHLVARLRQAGFEVGEAIVVPDEPAEVTRALLRLADEENMAVILTTGGTGLSPRDRTPEATRPLLEREAPGIAEAIRAAALQKTAHGMLSRGLAGTRGSTLIVNLPGSLKAVREGFEVLAAVLPHALDLLAGGQASPADHRAPPAATSTDESRHPGTPGAGLSP